MEDKKEISILYVDDDEPNLQGFKANFRRQYDVYTANSASEAKKILSVTEVHILITDQKMPEILGTQMLEELVKQYPQHERIMLTAYADSEAILDAFQKGQIYRYVLKPYQPDELKVIIDEAYRLYSLKRVKERLFEEWKKNNDELNKLGGDRHI
jgi:response regulator RpfG family c-di-GMP phosphodiesterase